MTPTDTRTRLSRVSRPSRLLALTAVAGIALAACGSSSKSSTPSSTPSTAGSSSSAAAVDVPGITATSVLIGTHQPLTGPAAPGYSEISAASQAYFDFVNAAGGVNGRKITLKTLDDGYNPTTTATDVNTLVLQDKVFAIFEGLGTPTHTAVLDFLAQNHVPDLFVASGSKSWNQPTKYPGTFGWQTDYTVEGKILGQYIQKNFAGKKVCSFGQNDDFGTDGVAGLTTTLGATALASKQTYDPTNTNVAPQVAALQAAGCQVVVSFSVPGFTALELGTAAKIGFKAQYVVSNVGSDYLTLAALLKTAAPLLLQGVVSDSYAPSPADTTNSWVQLFTKVANQYDNKIPLDGNVFYGMASAYTFVQALQAAGKNPTRQSIITAVENSHFTGPGLVPFRFSATDHSGYTGVRMGTITGGKFVESGPAYVTDDGTGPITEYSTAQPTAPADGIPPQ